MRGWAALLCLALYHAGSGSAVVSRFVLRGVWQCFCVLQRERDQRPAASVKVQRSRGYRHLAPLPVLMPPPAPPFASRWRAAQRRATSWRCWTARSSPLSATVRAPRPSDTASVCCAAAHRHPLRCAWRTAGLVLRQVMHTVLLIFTLLMCVMSSRRLLDGRLLARLPAWLKPSRARLLLCMHPHHGPPCTPLKAQCRQQCAFFWRSCTPFAYACLPVDELAPFPSPYVCPQRCACWRSSTRWTWTQRCAQRWTR